jgi:O-acetyl-ADP-ribose deacetylase (regulator of RNase III)
MSAHTKIQVVHGDITKVSVDAIVNAANSALAGGGGVDGAIHRAGGPAIIEACRAIVAKQGGCKTGQAVITTAGKLPAKYVIHTVGPVWKGGNHGEEKLLADCYLNSLSVAAANSCTSVAFPNISTGVYSFPKEAAAQIAAAALAAGLARYPEIQQVLLVCYDSENYKLTQAALGS